MCHWGAYGVLWCAIMHGTEAGHGTLIDFVCQIRKYLKKKLFWELLVQSQSNLYSRWEAHTTGGRGLKVFQCCSCAREINPLATALEGYAYTQRFPYIGSTWAACQGKLRPGQVDKIRILIFQDAQLSFHNVHTPAAPPPPLLMMIRVSAWHSDSFARRFVFPTPILRQF